MRPRLNRTMVATALLALALAGCGDAGGDDQIPTAGGSAEPEATGQRAGGDLSEQEMHEKALEFAACMREHGVDMEDPEPGEGIRVRIEGDPAQAEAAEQACRHLLPDGGAPPGSDPDARDDMLAFARCMRDNGVESFADPQEGEGIHLGPEQAEDPDFEEAERTCNERIFGGQPENQKGVR